MRETTPLRSLYLSLALLGLPFVSLCAETKNEVKDIENTPTKEEILKQETPSHSALFGYLSLKTGYSHESFAKTIFASVSVDKSAYLHASSAFALPLGVSAGFGYGFMPDFGLRIEVEYLYRLEAKFKNDELYSTSEIRNEITMRPRIQFQSVLANLYLDYYLTSSINLYINTGIGVSFSKSMFDYVDDNNPRKEGTLKFSSKTALWQVGLGIGYAFTKDFGLDLNLRYMDFGKTGFEPSKDIPAFASIPFSSIEMLLGLSYRF